MVPTIQLGMLAAAQKKRIKELEELVAEQQRVIAELRAEPAKPAQQGGSVDSTLLSMNKTVAAMISLSKQIVQAAEKMQRLTETTASLDALLADIETVANRSMVLAFNASIEASRAGAAGKGFTAVAAEVRKLAEQSRKTAEKTQTLTATINEEGTEVCRVLSQAATASRAQGLSAQSEAMKLMASIRLINAPAELDKAA